MSLLSELEKTKLYAASSIVSEIGEIRVLHLLPGLPHEDIRCRLYKTSLYSKNRREYEALSYTWGCGESSSMTLNDRAGFGVTTNLAGALRRLRHQHKPRTLWVDAICVNQADIAERNGQVRLMGDIFSSATGVLVWLGDVRQTNWMLPSEDCILYETVDGESRSYRSPEVRPVGSMDISATEMQRCALHGALHDTSPSWWERTWVVQEFCKAPANLQMCYGTFEESFDDFFSSEGLLWQLVAYNGHDGVCQSFWSAQYRLNDIRDKVRNGPMTILDFAENCFQAAATDARDKAYSLRSMISVDEAKWIEPDYHATTMAVFTRATFASIVGSGHLGILRYAWKTAYRDQSLPTWVVDFGDSSLLPNDDVRNQLRGPKLFEAPEPWTYATSYPAIQHPSLDEEFGILSLAGKLFDTIQSFEHLETCSLMTDSYITSAQARRVTSMLWKLLNVNNARESALLTDASKHRSRTFLQYLLDVFQNWYRWSGTALEAHDLLRDYALFSATQEDAAFSIFHTETGYLGLVRGMLQPGDVVVLLHGAPLPAILRPSGMMTTFEFVGFAIVAFLMGEQGGRVMTDTAEERYFAIT
ncbi:hypothetical protein AMS68_002199 [Peltaster fructicola]|uniref:Heterokaryon incompatibility domain-containing protein n=1 Tax=Peltaster fructicola TaxID=286661 RepID=A0A6H0XPJ1_9PEZI|nr:hypothetical protein AMS68_002199 [Peltaster fructicola]